MVFIRTVHSIRLSVDKITKFRKDFAKKQNLKQSYFVEEESCIGVAAVFLISTIYELTVLEFIRVGDLKHKSHLT